MSLCSQMVPTTCTGTVKELHLSRRANPTTRVRGVQGRFQEHSASAALCAACAFASVRNRRTSGDQRVALRQSAQDNVDTQDRRFETLKAQQEKVRQRVAEKKARRDQENDLPPPWRMVSHPSEPGKWYYYNEETGETSWTRPGSSPWRQVADPSTGKFYYYNQATGETSWEAPAELQELQTADQDSQANHGANQAAEMKVPQDEDSSALVEETALLEESEAKPTSATCQKGAATRLMAGESILAAKEEPLTETEHEIAVKPIDEMALKKDAEEREKRLGVLTQEAARRREVMKARREVMKGLRKKTSGGLTKDDLMVNKHGKIVSKKQHERGQKLFSRYLSSWIDAVKTARSKLSVLGFRAVGGRSKEGKELYMEAKQIYDQSRRDSNAA